MSDHQYGDLWRREEAMRKTPYEPPDVLIDDISSECICLQMNPAWVPFVTGALMELINPSLWIHADESYAPQEIIKLIEALMGGDTMPCAIPITNVTFEGGVINLHYANETTTVVENTELIVTGVAAIGGGFEVEQGGEFQEINPDCADPCEKYPDTPVYDKEGEQRACNIATNLTEWFFDRMNDVLDQAELANDTMKAVGSSLRYFPPAYLIYEAFVAVVFDWFDVGLSAVRAGDTVEMREAFKEALYCHIVDNGNILTAESWQAFKDSSEDPVPLLYMQWVGTLENDAVESEAHKASYGEASGCETYNCGDEPPCIEWDFTTSDWDWEVVATFGTWTDTIGWVHGMNGLTRRTDIRSPIWANENALTVTKIEVDCDYDAGANEPNQYVDCTIVGGGTEVMLDNYSPVEGEGITVIAEAQTVENVTRIRVSFQTSSNSGGGSCTIRKVRMYYTEGTADPELPECAE